MRVVNRWDAVRLFWLLLSCFVVATTHGMVAPERLPLALRTQLLNDAEKSFPGEAMIIPATDNSGSMTMAQRLIWQKNFHNARNAGLGLREAQDVALRGAVEGQVFDDLGGMDEDEDVDYTNRKVTCLACHFEIQDRAFLREHYSCDWHCINVKRKAAGLPPISNQDFEHRKDAAVEAESASKSAQASDEARLVAEQLIAHSKKQSAKLGNEIKKLLAEEDRASHARADLLLEKKTEAEDVIEEQQRILEALPERRPTQELHSEESEPEHDGVGYTLKRPGAQKKKGPRQTTAAAERRAAAEEKRFRKVEAAGLRPQVEELRSYGEISHLRCPFDGEVSADLEAALEHLASYHAFLPPFLPELADPSGLLALLVRKVYLGFVCVYCGISYSSPTAVQAHMESKGHCKAALIPAVALCVRHAVSSADVRVDDDFEEAMGRYYCALEGPVPGAEEEEEGQGAGAGRGEERGERHARAHEEGAGAGGEMASVERKGGKEGEVEGLVKGVGGMRLGSGGGGGRVGGSEQGGKEGGVGSGKGGQGREGGRRVRGAGGAGARDKDKEEEEEAKVRGLRAELGLGQWAGAKTVLKMAKKRGKGVDGEGGRVEKREAGRVEKRKGDMEALRKTMEKLKRQGMTRHGWRDMAVSKAMLAAPERERRLGGDLGMIEEAAGGGITGGDEVRERRLAVGSGDRMELRVAVANGVPGGALWLAKRREAGTVSEATQRRERKWKVQEGYRNYFTRKATLGKVPMQILNSGYRM